MMDYKKELDKRFTEECERSGCPPRSKFAFLGSDIFDFITYDEDIDEMFAKKMIEVIDCILNSKNLDYLKEKVNYINYLTMVNMPFMENKLEWGTSIRSAWFDEYGHHSEEQPTVYEMGSVNDLIVPKIEIKEFMKQLIEWSQS